MKIKFLIGNFDMIPIIRTQEELFSSTVINTYNKYKKEEANLVITNANFYDLTSAGKIDAFNGHDPVPASETTALGYVIKNNKLLTGKAAPLDFYIAYYKKEQYKINSSKIFDCYRSGQGNPPLNCSSAFGGLGPLIINGLLYGNSNLYTKNAPKEAPKVGDPGQYRKYLNQRNSAKYSAFERKDIDSNHTLGKTCIGINEDGIYIISQEEGDTNGMSIQRIRNYLYKNKCKHALFFDGSDSSLFFEKGSFVVKQGENKDETCTVGILFK